MPHSPLTHPLLTLSIPTTFLTLGLFALTSPTTCATALGLRPHSQPLNNNSLQTAMRLLGARDLSIAVALFAFWRRGQQEEMGVLVLSAMLLCAADVGEVWRARRDGWAVAMGVGAGVWGLVGGGLMGWL
ncbi:hypothetical protein Q7P37_005856 [Cladosporium fusiforme]